MVSSNRRRLSRVSAVSTAPLSISQEAPSTDAVVEIVADTMDASTTGDSDSANPPSLPDPSFAATETHLEVLSITNDLRKNGCPYTFLDVVA